MNALDFVMFVVPVLILVTAVVLVKLDNDS